MPTPAPPALTAPRPPRPPRRARRARRAGTALATGAVAGLLATGLVAAGPAATATTAPAATASTASTASTAPGDPAPAASSALAVPHRPPVGTYRTVRTYDFSRGQTPENIAFAPDGTRYVTLAFAGQLEIQPRRGPARILQFPGRHPVAGGVVVTRRGEALVTLSSPDAGAAGIWRVGRGDVLTRVAALPATGAHNGMAVDRRGTVYVADSVLGQVYRLLPGSSAAEVWRKDPLLDPDPSQSLEGIPFPGANGVKVFRGAVYVSNSSRPNVLRIPILRDGSAGPVEVAYPGVVADDFAFDVLGNLYTTTDPFQTVERIAPDGATTVLLTARDGLDGPSAVAFGVGRERTTLYITELGLFGTSHRPKLSTLVVGVPGAPVR